MDARRKVLTEQVVVRLEPAMHHALKADAAANGRTLAQTIRFHLGQTLSTASDHGVAHGATG